MAAPEILSMIENMRDRIFFFGVLPTLKYLAMSGRVSHIAAGIANVINIQPILTIRDGKLDYSSGCGHNVKPGSVPSSYQSKRQPLARSND
jgi:hypothetical protein